MLDLSFLELLSRSNRLNFWLEWALGSIWQTWVIHLNYRHVEEGLPFLFTFFLRQDFSYTTCWSICWTMSDLFTFTCSTQKGWCPQTVCPYLVGLSPSVENSAQINLGPSSVSPLFSIKFQLKPPSRRYYPPGNDHISPLKARLSRWFSFFLFGGICCSLEGISGWTRIIHPNNEIYPRCSEFVDYLPTINSLHGAFWVWIKNYLVTPCWVHAILRVFCLGPFVVSFEKWVLLEPNFRREMYFLHMLLMAQIRRSPVEVGSLSHHF